MTLGSTQAAELCTAFQPWCSFARLWDRACHQPGWLDRCRWVGLSSQLYKSGRLCAHLTGAKGWLLLLRSCSCVLV